MKKKPDYGQIMIFMAIAVGLPRWAGAMMTADGIDISVGWLSDVFTIANGLSGFGMAVLEVLAVGYIFASLREQTAFEGWRPNPKFWGSAVFGIAILALIPFILTPFMLSHLRAEELTITLAGLNLELGWLLAVVVAPLLIVGGVAFARAGIMEIEDTPTPKKRGRPKGSKNTKKKTTKKRGRPKGSKNKKKEETPEPPKPDLTKGWE